MWGKVHAMGLAAMSAWLMAAPPAAGQIQFHAEAAGARLRVLSWRELPFRSVVRQEYDFSCGSAALATLLTHHYGQPTSEADAFTRMYADGDQATIRKGGFSMLDMKRYLVGRGLRAEGYRTNLDEIGIQGTPVIARIQLGAYRHFVVVKGVSGDSVLVGDPALGRRVFSKAQFAAMWNGVVLGLRDDAPGAFNLASDWSAPAGAPLRTAAAQTPRDIMTLSYNPLYQITPVSVINGGDP